MATRKYGAFKSIIVLGCDHAGLRPKFQALEDEMNRVVNTREDPREVIEYLAELGCASRDWFIAFERVKGEK